MKTLLKSLLVTAGLAVVVLPAVQATDAAPAAPAPTPAQRLLAHRRALGREVARRLDLTAGQIAKLKAIRAERAAAIKAIRADGSLTAEQKKAKARAALQGVRGELRSVLTAEQQAQFDRMLNRLRHRLHRLRA